MMDLPKIRAYTLSTCPYCNAFKKFMEENDIPFEYTDVDFLEGRERREIIAEINEICPYCSYPIIMIGGRVIDGFNENRMRKVLGI